MTRQEQIAEYQRLLSNEWSEATLASAQALVRSFSAYNEARVSPEELAALSKVIGSAEDDDLGMTSDLVTGLVAVRLSGDSLLRDAVALLADLAVDTLWENDDLREILMLVAQHLYEDQPSRRHALEAEIYDARRDHEAALGSWTAALATTHPDDHDYLSHVQTVWFAYVSLGREDDAVHLVAALPSDLRVQFLAELDAGFSRRPKEDAVASLRIHANLPFGSNSIGSGSPRKNSLAPRGSAGDGAACRDTT